MNPPNLPIESSGQKAVNQWLGDMMILQVLADSDCVNEQEREVLTRWMAGSAIPAASPSSVDGAARGDGVPATDRRSVFDDEIDPNVHDEVPPAAGVKPVALTLETAPIGTRAPAIGGGAWCKTERGWKWNGPHGSGGTFPGVGGDWSGKLVPEQQWLDANPHYARNAGVQPSGKDGA